MKWDAEDEGRDEEVRGGGVMDEECRLRGGTEEATYGCCSRYKKRRLEFKERITGGITGKKEARLRIAGIGNQVEKQSGKFIEVKNRK